MKYNINKLQEGGAINPTFLIRQSTAQPMAPSGASADSEQSSILDQDLYKKLISDGGLVSDVNTFAKQLENTQQSPFAFLEVGNRSNALQMFAKVNELRQNKENWKSAYETAKSSGGLGEIAVGGNREVYVKDNKGNIKVIGLSELEKNRQNYNPMTVAQLLEARATDERLAYNTSSFDIANYSVGTDKIYDRINSIVDKMGSITNDKTSYVDTKDLSVKISKETGLPEASSETLQGIAQIKQAIGSGPEGLYKITSKSVNPNVQKAFNYIWGSLTEQEKNKLTANAVLSGVKGNDPISVVQNAINMQASPTKESKVDYQGDINDPTGTSKSGSGSTGGLTKQSPMELLIQGEAPDGKIYEWNLENTGLKLKSPSYGSNKILGLDDKPIGFAKLSEVDQTDVGLQSDINRATFGGEIVGIGDKDKIVVDNSDAHKVYLPVDRKGNPDYYYLQKVTDANEQIENTPNVTPYQAAEIYRGAGLRVNQYGNLETTDLKPFIVITAYTTDQSGVTKNNPFIKKLKGDWNPWTSDEEKTIENVTKEAFARTEDGKNKGRQPMGSWYLGGETWYKGMVAYPLKETAPYGVAAQHGNVYDAKRTVSEIKQNLAGEDLTQNTNQLIIPRR